MKACIWWKTSARVFSKSTKRELGCSSTKVFKCLVWEYSSPLASIQHWLLDDGSSIRNLGYIQHHYTSVWKTDIGPYWAMQCAECHKIALPVKGFHCRLKRITLRNNWNCSFWSHDTSYVGWWREGAGWEWRGEGERRERKWARGEEKEITQCWLVTCFSSMLLLCSMLLLVCYRRRR